MYTQAHAYLYTYTLSINIPNIKEMWLLKFSFREQQQKQQGASSSKETRRALE